MINLKKENLRLLLISMQALRPLFFRAGIITIIYVAFAVYLMNATLVWKTVVSEEPILFKFKFLFLLLGSAWTAMDGLHLSLVVIIGFLVGCNVVLFARRVTEACASGSLGVLFGGGSLLGLLTGGCAACGAPLLGLLGFGIAVISPLYITLSSIFAIIVLSLSLYFMSRPSTCAAK